MEDTETMSPTECQEWAEAHGSYILDGSRGIYLPQAFALKFERRNMPREDWSVLAIGPDHEFYWETWDDVLNNWRGPGGEWISTAYDGGVLLFDEPLPDNWNPDIEL